jgi:hypothetical protein
VPDVAQSQGIMVRYHIPNIAREKILREIAARTQQQVLGVMNNMFVLNAFWHC